MKAKKIKILSVIFMILIAIPLNYYFIHFEYGIDLVGSSWMAGPEYYDAQNPPMLIAMGIDWYENRSILIAV